MAVGCASGGKDNCGLGDGVECASGAQGALGTFLLSILHDHLSLICIEHLSTVP